MKGRSVRAAIAGVLAVAVLCSVAVTAGAQATPQTEVSTDGVGKPPPGSGIGTKAALENPKCDPDAIKGYGIFPYVTTAQGPMCVAPAPADNGGATARGVTKDKVKVVVVDANAAQLAQQANGGGAGGAMNLATGQAGTFEDAMRDAWAPVPRGYELWGREVEFVFIESTGGDEAAQRADAVTVDQAKPFIVIDSTPNGLTTLQTALAAKKYIVYGYGLSVKDTLAQAPYRWGQTDQQAGALNAAEFAGKQLTKGKAEYAGSDDLKSKPRAFGVVYSSAIDLPSFEKAFAQYGGKLATPGLQYQAPAALLGDAALAQQQAPTMISKLKSAGVTTVFLMADAAMITALLAQATAQDFHPEWITTGYNYSDLSLISRGYDQGQWAHAFGISNLSPLVDAAASTATVSALAWYWGANNYTSSSLASGFTGFIAAALHYAGPTLTAQNVQKGLFAVPARGGAASNTPLGFMLGYGKTPGLPYDEYMQLGLDYAPVWYDAETTGESQVRPVVAKGVTWYPNDAKRYRGGTWPTKKIPLFDKAQSVYFFKTSPIESTSQPLPCTGCPSTGGPGTPSNSGA